MASEPNWELWRHIDSAPLWHFVALLAGLEPDSIRMNWRDDEWKGANEKFATLLRIADSSVRAHKLRCQGYGSDPRQNNVLMPEFLRWAASKGFSIPPELRPLEETGDSSASVSAATTIRGIDELRVLIEALGGPVLGDAAAVRSFAKKAGIMKDGDNPRHTTRTWSRAEIEPKLTVAIESLQQKGLK